MRKLGIITVSDLLYFAPQRYIDYSFDTNYLTDTQTPLSSQNKDEANIDNILSNTKGTENTIDHKTSSKSEVSFNKKISLLGYINKIEIRKSWKSKIPMAQAILESINTEFKNKKIKLFWFNQPYMGKIYKDGDRVLISGEIEAKDNLFVMSNPYIEKLKSFPETQTNLFNQNSKIVEEKILPIYKETNGITSRFIFECVKKILPEILKLAEIESQSDIYESLISKSVESRPDNSQSLTSKSFESLPTYILKELSLPSLFKTFLYLHMPRSAKDYKAAQKRLLFEEIFYIQLNIQRERLISSRQNAYIINNQKKIIAEFYKKENITPTNAQERAVKDILIDLESGRPMQRLLEGDVGSGKTLVAAIASLVTINSKRDNKQIGTPLQVAYLAPTEILAKQQFESFIKYFEHTNISVAYLSSKEAFKFPSKIYHDQYTKIAKTQLIKWIESGEISVLIGTHAITKKSITFKDLALTIIDEQHRFGVETRKDLAHKKGDKRNEIPHLLSMSATPIPRTLALSIFGDLDLSIIDELPKGRKPIVTKLKRSSEEKEVFENIKNKIDQGRQVFVICTKIEDGEDNRKSVESEVKRLKSIFKKYIVCGLHSKTPKNERDQIMSDFKNKKIHILIATSIIEVGVNIPNASIMIIQDADRFGLSQLHQMRGRVGRGEYDSECILFSNTVAEDTIKRLKTFEKVNDGFVLAEEDLNTRGPGGIISGKQSGLSDIAMEAIKNLKLVELARKYAKEITDKDPNLSIHTELVDKLKKISDIHLE